MAMKDWSIGKIVGVMFGVFFALLVFTVVVANVVKKRRASSTVVDIAPSAQAMGPSPGIAPTRAAASRQHSDTLLDDQLSQLSDQISTVQQQMERQSQQAQQNNQSIMQNFNTIQGEIKSLADRVTALEHPSTGPVQVVKTPEKPRVPLTKRLARSATQLPRRSGYQVEAVVSDRAWLRVDGAEATRAVGEDLPQASAPARIDAMSADSGVFVVPVKSH